MTFFSLLSAAGGTDLSFMARFSENVKANLVVLVILGLLGGKIVHRIELPKVTGYIIAGVIMGPSVLNIINEHMVEDFTIIREVAIGFIGYTIGLELRFKKMKETGKMVSIITLTQAVFTAVFVCLATAFVVTEHNWTYGLIFGAIATATAPAPIIAVVKGYRTKGPVTDTLLPLVALDDAIGIVLFSILLSFGVSLLGIEGQHVTFWTMMSVPLKEIGYSIMFGGVIGFVLSKVLIALNRDDDNMLMMVIIAFVLLGIGVGHLVHASPILLPLVIGTVLTNSVNEKYEHRFTKTTDLFTAPIFLAFFTIAGAELDLAIIPTVGLVGVAYILVRVVGKVSGSYVSAKAVKAPPTVVKYLGWTLIPQAGVAINMAITTELRFGGLPGYETIGSTIMTVVLAATLVYEVFGLIIVKIALTKAGEIHAGEKSWDM